MSAAPSPEPRAVRCSAHAPALSDTLLTALAPMLWGGTYIVTTQTLPQGHPVAIAMLRCLPAGLLLLALTRTLPKGVWILRTFVLAAFNFSILWILLFIAAYRLPGGVVATISSTSPLMVVFLAACVLKTVIRLHSILTALAGTAGVALLVLGGHTQLDVLGLIASFAFAACLALATVLSKLWLPPVSSLTFAAWQLTAGGLLLLPIWLMFDCWLPPANPDSLLGLVYLSLLGAALAYILWFRGIARLTPSAVSSLLFLSPVTAFILGWYFLDETMTLAQGLAIALILGSIWLEGWLSRQTRFSSLIPPFKTRNDR